MHWPWFRKIVHNKSFDVISNVIVNVFLVRKCVHFLQVYIVCDNNLFFANSFQEFCGFLFIIKFETIIILESNTVAQNY